MQRPVEYVDYDKISDDVCFLGSNTLLRFHVSLAKKDADGNRYHFHKEYMYNSSSYNQNQKLISVKRSFNYFLTIEKTDQRDSNIMIRPQDMIYLQSKLPEVMQLVGDGTYGTKRGKLIIIKKKEPVVIPNLAGGKYLMFEQIILQWENTNTSSPGIRITLSDKNIYSDISVDKLYEFLYTINTFNMYQSAQLLLNYMQRPPYGTNMYEFENMQLTGNGENLAGVAKGKEGRQIKVPKPNKSYFDKIDELDG